MPLRPLAVPARAARAAPCLRAAAIALGAVFAGACGNGERALTGLAPTALPLAASTGSSAPRLSRDPRGQALLSWLQPVDGERVALRYARLGDDDTWSAPVTVAGGDDWFVNGADVPSVIETGPGTLAAHWLRRNGPGQYAYDVMLAVSGDAGASWSAPFRAHDDASATEHGFVSLFTAGDAFGAVWLDGRELAAGGAMHLREARFDLAGNKLGERAVDERVCDCCQTDVASSGNRSWLAYRDRSLSEIRDIAISELDGEGFAPGRVIVADRWRIDGCPVNGPAVATSGSALALAWYTAADDAPRIRLARSFDRGLNFVEATLTTAGTPLGRVDLVALPDGSVVLSWVESTDDGASFNAQHYDRLGNGGPVRRIAVLAPTRQSGFPQMVLHRNRLVFAWTDVSGDTTRVASATAPIAWFEG